jgi:transposase
MAVALSFDRRRRVVAAVEGGVSCRAAADRFGVARSTAIKRLRRWRRARGGDKRSHRLESHASRILALIDEMPDITRAEVVAHLQERHDLKVAPSTVWRRLNRHGFGCRTTAHATAPQQADVRQRRLAWFAARPAPVHLAFPAPASGVPCGTRLGRLPTPSATPSVAPAKRSRPMTAETTARPQDTTSNDRRSL